MAAAISSFAAAAITSSSSSCSSSSVFPLQASSAFPAAVTVAHLRLLSASAFDHPPRLCSSYARSSSFRKLRCPPRRSHGGCRQLCSEKRSAVMNLQLAVDSLSQGYFPGADFYKVEAIVRPWRLPHVASALLQSGIRGVTVSDVRGFGAQGGSRERQAGSEFTEDNFVTKVKLEIVVSSDQVEAVIETIIDQARTGEIGDGKIFVVPVADVIRIRTGERGLKAERMAGGRSELLSTMN